jgi:drug/metabolite transporter (DMT)-like permease
MLSKQSPRLQIAIALSLVASLILVSVPFVSRSTPIGPFMFANWALMMIVGWLALPRFSWRHPFQRPDRDKGRLFALVLVAFTLAGYIAIFNAQSLVQADDLDDLRTGMTPQSN